MSTYLRKWLLATVVLVLAGCQARMIPMHNLYNQHVNGELGQAAIGEAIKSGAVSAGWRIDAASESNMFATYNIRAHTVVVNIGYSADRYSILYRGSSHMKVKCGTRPDSGMKPKVTSSASACPGDTVPTQIHENYKDWIEQLNRSISAALQSACFADERCRS